MHGAIALLDPALKWCVRGLKIVETEQPIGVFDVVAVDLTSAWGWDCFWYPTVKPKAGQSKTDAMRSAAPVSGAPLDGGHADRPIGVTSAEWRSLVGRTSKTKRSVPLMRRTRRSWKAM